MSNSIALLKLCNYVLQGIIYFWFFYHVLDSQRNFLHCAAEMTVITISLNYVNAWMLTIPLLSAQWVKPLVNSVVIVVAIMLILKVPFKKAVVNAYIPFMILIAMGELLTFSLASSLMHMNIAGVYEQAFDTTALLYFMNDSMDIVVLLIALRIFGRGDIGIIPGKMLSIAFVGILFQVIVLSMLSYIIIYGAKINTIAVTVITIMFILGEAGFFYMHSHIRKAAELRMQSKEIESSEKTIDEQMNYLAEENSKAEALQTEIEAAVDHIDSKEDSLLVAEHYHAYRDHVYTDNIILNASLMSYAERFHVMHIDYDFEIMCSMENTLNDLDIVKLFSNLLDNAMEAVEGNPEKYRTISLKVEKASNLYRIELNNNLPRKYIALNKKVQGEGIRIVRDLLSRYNGSMKFTEDKTMHNVEVLFQIGGEPQS